MRAGYDGAKGKKALETAHGRGHVCHLPALHVIPANRDDCAEVGRRVSAIEEVTDESVELAYVDQGYTGEKPAEEAWAHGIALEVVKLPEAKRGFALLPRRWVVERPFAWTTRCRRPVKDYEHYTSTLVNLYVIVFVCFIIRNAAILSSRCITLSIMELKIL